jgi:hypothetical protein
MPYRKLILKCSAEKHLIIFRIMIAPRLPNLSGAGVFYCSHAGAALGRFVRQYSDRNRQKTY